MTTWAQELQASPGNTMRFMSYFFKKEKKKDKIKLKPSWQQHISVTFPGLTSINTSKALKSMFQIGIIPTGTQRHGFLMNS